MSKKEQVEQLTQYMANFVAYIGKMLPDDIIAKLDELAEKEDSPLKSDLSDNEKKSEPGKRTEQTKLPGYGSTAVLGEMRNKLSADRRA